MRLGSKQDVQKSFQMRTTLQRQPPPILACPAKIRLADEYDAAQSRREVAKRGDNQYAEVIGVANNQPVTVADLGISSYEIHEARTLRDAEELSPREKWRTEGLLICQNPRESDISITQ